MPLLKLPNRQPEWHCLLLRAPWAYGGFPPGRLHMAPALAALAFSGSSEVNAGTKLLHGLDTLKDWRNQWYLLRSSASLRFILA